MPVLEKSGYPFFSSWWRLELYRIRSAWTAVPTSGPTKSSENSAEGGMGQVYRARDTRLNRDVAIKVLPALFAVDPDRLSRFSREAQTLVSDAANAAYSPTFTSPVVNWSPELTRRVAGREQPTFRISVVERLFQPSVLGHAHIIRRTCLLHPVPGWVSL
jgi:hypothetical protein